MRCTKVELLVSSSIGGGRRTRRLNAPRYEALIDLISPVVHRVVGVAPLPHIDVLDRCAADTLVDCCSQQLSCHRIVELDGALSGTDERVSPGCGHLDNTERSSLRHYDGDRSQDRNRGGGVSES